MTETDLTTDHKVLGDDPIAPRDSERARNWNPLVGVFALWVGLVWLVLRMMSVMAPPVLVSVILAMPAYAVMGEMGFLIVLSFMSVVVLPFWIIPTFRFALPAYIDLVRLSGIFLQKTGRLWPVDTLDAVNRRWSQLHADGRRWWRCWLARR